MCKCTLLMNIKMSTNKSKVFKLIIMIFLLTLVTSVGGFFVTPKTEAKADTNYTITFKNGDEVVKTLVKASGSDIVEGDLPTNQLPSLTKEYYKWFYSTNNGQTLFRVTEKGDEDNIIFQNVNSDIIFWVKTFPLPSSYCKVTFVLPDTTRVTKTVEKGGTVDEPTVDLGFCERVKYDKSLENINEDMTINVSIDNTYKYIFMVGCLTALITSLIVIVVVVFKALKVEDDDDEDDVEFEESSNQLFEKK